MDDVILNKTTSVPEASPSSLALALLGVVVCFWSNWRESRRLAILTLVLGVVALLEAVDDFIVVLPLPVGPVWVRVILEIAWIAWTASALARGARGSSHPVKAAV